MKIMLGLEMFWYLQSYVYYYLTICLETFFNLESRRAQIWVTDNQANLLSEKQVKTVYIFQLLELL
jgi:hypothetical protein